MRYALFAILALVVLLAMFAARVQAAPDWITPPGGTVPPEPPTPAPGSVDSDPGCATVEYVTLSPRWFMPFVTRYAELAPAQ